jgi:hypothetical protein
MHYTGSQKMLLNQFGVIPEPGFNTLDHFLSGDGELGRWSSEW